MSTSRQSASRRALGARHPVLRGLFRCPPHVSAHSQVHLYQLFKDFVIKKHTLAVYSRKVAISVSDNLLIVHAIDAKVALIFDLLINTQYPITAPLPMAMIAEDGFSPLFSPHWSLAPPNYIIDPQAGRVGQLQLDLSTIMRSSIDKVCLLQFLLARSCSVQEIIDTFATSVAEEEGLPVLGRMFDLLHATVARNLLQRRAFCSTSVAASSLSRAACTASCSACGASAMREMEAGAARSPSDSVTLAAARGDTNLATALAVNDIAVDAGAATKALAGVSTGGGLPMPCAYALSANASPAGSDQMGGRASCCASYVSRPRPTSAPACSPSTASARSGDGAGFGIWSGDRGLEDDVGARVFEAAARRLPALVHERCPQRRYLIAVLAEYLRSQQQHALPLDERAGGP